MSALLKVEDLNVRIGTTSKPVHAVRGVNFGVHRGETVCIVGESGCGKSMASLALVNLLPPQGKRTVRRLELGGKDISALSDAGMSAIRGRRMSMIFQDPMTSLNPTFTIGEQLRAVYFRHFGRNRAAAHDRSVELLEQTGISGAAQRLGQYPHQLSGGLRQRVMIAMALICRPELLIADEPTTALDVTIQVQILQLLRKLQRDLNLGILLITHDMGVVARTADRLMVMYAGQIVETGRTEEVFNDPAHPYTRGLLSSILRPGQRERGTPLEIIPGVVPSLSEAFNGCAFANRCAYATPQCVAAPVGFHEDTQDRGWRCIRPQERAATTEERVV